MLGASKRRPQASTRPHTIPAVTTSQSDLPWPGPRQLGAAAVILDDDQRVLLVKHTYGKLNWELPGGLSEAGESAAATAIREVAEEVGIEVTDLRLAGLYYSEPGDMHHFAFLCSAGPGAKPRPSSPEISELGFFPRDQLPRPMSDFTIRRIDDGLAGAAVTQITRVGPRVWFE